MICVESEVVGVDLAEPNKPARQAPGEVKVLVGVDLSAAPVWVEIGICFRTVARLLTL